MKFHARNGRIGAPWSALLVAAVALAAAGCDDGGGETALPGETALTTDDDGVLACGSDGCNNVVDSIVLPLMAQRDLAVRPETSERLCRRLSIDLWGRVPTWGEVETLCIGRTPAEAVEAFMGAPDYVLQSQRLWADRFQYNDERVWWRYIEELDSLVGELYREELTYSELAERALAHPAFVRRFDGDARVGAAFRIFMGRDALPSERTDLASLWAMWDDEKVTDPEWGHKYQEMVIDTRRCSGTLSLAGCTALLYGGGQVVLPLVDTEDPDSDANVLALGDLTDEQWDTLRLPGRLLARLPVFREAAVDEVTMRYLGYEAGALIPEVRTVLMDLLADTGSIVAVERELVSSVLYLQAAYRPDSIETTDEIPLSDESAAELEDRLAWAFGPTKQMRVETWMDSIQRFAAYGHTDAWMNGEANLLSAAYLGGCDHRFPEMKSGEVDGETIYHPSKYPLEDAAINRPDFSFRDFARNLGGCPNYVQHPRFTGSGVIISLEQRRFVQSACFHETSFGMYPAGVEPDDISLGAVDAIVVHHARQALGRQPTDDERDSWRAGVQECLANSEECPAAEVARKMCAAVLSSAEFLYY